VCVWGGLAVEYAMKNKGKKINAGLKRPLMDDRTLNNQPKTGGRDGR
jgi:hypothetical protein